MSLEYTNKLNINNTLSVIFICRVHAMIAELFNKTMFMSLKYQTSGLNLVKSMLLVGIYYDLLHASEKESVREITCVNLWALNPNILLQQRLGV